ncbi:uncharacterized protein BX664DRAFT_273431 [Halteromyces radiatus]|uniref:uncharacterized protein n=1 Tax=Halteromyces radiatus TaxID=101107 RepID=UPI002220FDFE|nr:uncharacterized protein BX664DRAFT_273431 [Halteromyces radiatus]KAI8099894.1 hypothetical protein BX664DRAFT_273431 [Halteromyces radiatus]
MTIYIDTMTMSFITEIQQPKKPSDSIHPLPSISKSNTTTNSSNSSNNDDDEKSFSFKPLPSIVIDYFALTMCDFLPTKPIQERTAPELMYFIQKITYNARISCYIAVVAWIYIDRCKAALPQRAIGDQDTAHRMIIASLLVASKFLHGTRWGASQQLDGPHDVADESKPYWLTNQRMKRLCDDMYTLQEINQLERSFLNLIDYQCWVDEAIVQDYLVKHRQELLL